MHNTDIDIDVHRPPAAENDLENETLVLTMLSRAIRAGEDSAWQAFIEKYSGLVIAHLRRHPAYASVYEDDHFWVGRTFQRFAGAMGADRLALFPSLPAVLKYLKLCAHSVLLDEVRARQHRPHTSLEAVGDWVDAGVDVEHSVVLRLTAQELWAAVAQELPDDSERLIARLSFEYGYKPAQIHACHKDRFHSVAEVYRGKRNLVERLRRSPRVRHLLS